jgi:hypothetical protein
MVSHRSQHPALNAHRRSHDETRNCANRAFHFDKSAISDAGYLDLSFDRNRGVIRIKRTRSMLTMAGRILMLGSRRPKRRLRRGWRNGAKVIRLDPGRRRRGELAEFQKMLAIPKPRLRGLKFLWDLLLLLKPMKPAANPGRRMAR